MFCLLVRGSTLSALLIGLAGVSQAQWIAVNDVASGPGTAANVTRYHPFGDEDGSCGPLRDVNTGQTLPATLTMTRTGFVNLDRFGATPPQGTPLYNTFAGLVDFAGNSTNNVGLGRGPVPSPGVVIYTLSGLDPTRQYLLQGGAVRGGPNYTNRWTLFELAGADGLVGAHQGGLTTAQVDTIATNQVAINTGIQTGDMFEWQEVNPGSDGILQIICTLYKGTVPGGSSSGTAAYALTALRIQEAVLTAPTILTDPQSQTVTAGDSVTWTVVATGYPLYFQWFRNTEPVLGATNHSYTLTNTSVLDNGATFFVVVSNSFGTAISSTAQLRVITLGEALNCTNLVWTLNMDWPLWHPQNEVTHDGELALQSGTFTRSNEKSELSTVAEGPGTLSFWWKMQSPNAVSSTTFDLDGRTEFQLSGEVGWQYQRIYLSSNSHTLTWTVFLSSAPASDGVTAWLDEVTYRPGTLGEALNCTNLVWTMDEDWPLWCPQTDVTHDGELALQSGAFTRSYEKSELSTVAEGPGTLSFWWKMHSPNAVSSTTFKLDDRIELRLSGEVDWQYQKIYLSSNRHTLIWAVYINSAPASDGVTGWLDEVTYLQGGAPPEIIASPTNLTVVAGGTATFRVGADGRPPLSYQWQCGGLDLPGATGAAFAVQNAQAPDAGAYTVIVAK